MRCSECDHVNTEGAWLCINCGAKLPRTETQGDADPAVDSTSPAESETEDPSQFAPQISENLRRLREQTERDRGPQRRRESSGQPPSAVLGIPIVVWASIIFVFIVLIWLLSQIQSTAP